MNAFLIIAVALVASVSAQEDGSYRPEVHEAPFAYRGEGEAESHPAPEPQQQAAPQPQQIQYAQQPSFGNFQGFPFNVQVPQVQAQQYVQQPQHQYVQQQPQQYVQQQPQQYVQQQAQPQAEDGSYRPDLYEAPYAYRGEQ